MSDVNQELAEAIEEAIDALDFYAAPNCWGDPNVAAQTAAKLRETLAGVMTPTTNQSQSEKPILERKL